MVQMATGIRAASNLCDYAAASSTIRDRQRAPKMRRRSEDDTWSPRWLGIRKYSRGSSKAEQKRVADSICPNPNIG